MAERRRRPRSGRAAPTQLGDALQSFLSETDVGERIQEASAVPEWAERVGPAIAAVTIPLRVSHGILFVGVRSSAWLMELTVMEGEILRRLNGPRQRGRISKIRFQMWAD
jgi:predicted nucleic acid-binding Zn ribbon protein